MILQALCDYYERKPDLPRPGFETKAIPFVIEINSAGQLVQIEDTRTLEGKKKIARNFVVPQGEKKTSGVCAPRKGDKPAEGQIGIQGRKFTVPYGLYAAHGFVSSFLAKQTGFDENDLELLWQALAQMFEHDRSAARGEMSTRGLYVFKHDGELGNAPAHNLFDLIRVKKNTEEPARDFADYTITVKEADIPSGVSLQRKVG